MLLQKRFATALSSTHLMWIDVVQVHSRPLLFQSIDEKSIGSF